MQLHFLAPLRICGALFMLAVAGACSNHASGQALFKLHPGDDVSSSELSVRVPKAKNSFKQYWAMKWTLDNGNDLSITMTEDGKIVFLESDWNGKSSDTSCDLPWLKFGVTSLADIRKQFGSNGFAFQGRHGLVQAKDGVVMMNSYEVGSSIVTFYTKVSEDDYAKAKTSEESWAIADHARLEAISTASAEYAESEWGDRIVDPGYKPVSWK